MTETSFLLIVPFLASMTDIPCCRVPAQLSMAYKEISPFPASLALRCGALPAITASGALLLCSTPVPPATLGGNGRVEAPGLLGVAVDSSRRGRPTRRHSVRGSSDGAAVDTVCGAERRSRQHHSVCGAERRSRQHHDGRGTETVGAVQPAEYPSVN